MGVKSKILQGAGTLGDYLLRVGDIPYDPSYAGRKSDLAKLDNLTSVRSYQGNTMDVPTVSLLDFIDRPYIITQSDRTDADALLKMINGTELEEPVFLTGGQGHMWNKDDLWASAEDQMKVLDEMARLLKERYKQDPILIPQVMTGKGSDFSHLTGETMISYIKSNMSPRERKAFDKHMKAIAPHWSGLEQSSVIDAFNDLPAGERMRMQDAMDKRFRDDGGLSLAETRAVISDPNQLSETRGTLRNVGLMDTDAGLKKIGNSSYDTSNSGTGIGVLKEKVSVPPNSRSLNELREDIPSKHMDERANWENPHKDLLSALTKSHRGGVFDEDTVKKMIAAGSSAPLFTAISAKADPVSDLRTSEAQWDMSPEERAIDDLRASESEFRPDMQWKPSYADNPIAQAIGKLKENKNYQNFENLAPFGTGLIDFVDNSANDRDNGLLDYIFAGGDLALLPAPLKKAAKGLMGMF